MSYLSYSLGWVYFGYLFKGLVLLQFRDSPPVEAIRFASMSMILSAMGLGEPLFGEVLSPYRDSHNGSLWLVRAHSSSPSASSTIGMGLSPSFGGVLPFLGILVQCSKPFMSDVVTVKDSGFSHAFLADSVLLG